MSRSTALPEGYELVRLLGAGGFGEVHLARQVSLGRLVAVKRIHSYALADDESLARFRREARTLAGMSHPTVVRVYDFQHRGGDATLIMEYVDGQSLGQALSEMGAFPVRDAIRITRQVAEALAYLHEQGYLHRDVKPDNVLLDQVGNVKLCDLGFAVPVPRHAAPADKPATAVGTAGYMSPEVLSGAPAVKVGSDIYSLGIHLYALLTGHEPYSGASSQEVVTDQIETGMPVPNLMVVNAPPDVIQLLKKMMHPDPNRRFASVQEVIAAIDRLKP